ncbi:hypothetical protein BBOV_III011720 [Babesia bovis T2Bo]|uniref:Uncharacterized protein n=1 Tax=Babesia bovis TaxID=5865 RepID=A7AQ90_BABBO|nr:hypothetical protein BBOV_III011720 [Babesia bovis T2Bo]EDO08724.1 hypothetical protein BBOV_III011720 [Babesia bovis T2Bo]|eukprot:XP_001612292.1 hypothetical protein [Babesia bovis T2Bo]
METQGIKSETSGICLRIAQIYESFHCLNDDINVQGDAPCHVEPKFVIPENISTVIRKALWEEDVQGIDLSTQFYNPESVESQPEVSDGPDVISVEPTDVEPTPVREEANQPVESEVDDEILLQTKNGAESNFIHYTYWTLEKGSNVSYTSKPLYATGRNEPVTLLEEAEAFVSLSIWGGPKAEPLHSVPRHLLVQVAQVASRAFFDPDYRKYLLRTYLS